MHRLLPGADLAPGEAIERPAAQAGGGGLTPCHTGAAGRAPGGPDRGRPRGDQGAGAEAAAGAPAEGEVTRDRPAAQPRGPPGRPDPTGRGTGLSGVPGGACTDLRNAAGNSSSVPAPRRLSWSFGGGLLFRGLAQAGLVDGVEVAVIPVLLGGRIPLLPPPANQIKLKLTGHKVYKTGIVGLEYAVE